MKLECTEIIDSKYYGRHSSSLRLRKCQNFRNGNNIISMSSNFLKIHGHILALMP